MRVGYNALPDVFFTWQTFLFNGALENVSIQRPILKRFVTQTYSKTDSRPTNQSGSDTLACGHDGFFGRDRLLFECRALELQAGSLRHAPAE